MVAVQLNIQPIQSPEKQGYDALKNLKSNEHLTVKVIIISHCHVYSKSWSEKKIIYGICIGITCKSVFVYALN